MPKRRTRRTGLKARGRTRSRPRRRQSTRGHYKGGVVYTGPATGTLPARKKRWYDPLVAPIGRRRSRKNLAKQMKRDGKLRELKLKADSRVDLDGARAANTKKRGFLDDKDTVIGVQMLHGGPIARLHYQTELQLRALTDSLGNKVLGDELKKLMKQEQSEQVNKKTRMLLLYAHGAVRKGHSLSAYKKQLNVFPEPVRDILLSRIAQSLDKENRLDERRSHLRQQMLKAKAGADYKQYQKLVGDYEKIRMASEQRRRTGELMLDKFEQNAVERTTGRTTKDFLRGDEYQEARDIVKRYGDLSFSPDQ